jgi:hypothetical protein
MLFAISRLPKKASHLVPAKKLGANIGEIGPRNAK